MFLVRGGGFVLKKNLPRGGFRGGKEKPMKLEVVVVTRNSDNHYDMEKACKFPLAGQKFFNRVWTADSVEFPENCPEILVFELSSEGATTMMYDTWGDEGGWREEYLHQPLLDVWDRIGFVVNSD